MTDRRPIDRECPVCEWGKQAWVTFMRRHELVPCPAACPTAPHLHLTCTVCGHVSSEPVKGDKSEPAASEPVRYCFATMPDRFMCQLREGHDGPHDSRPPASGC